MLRGKWGWLSLWLPRYRCISGNQLKLCLAYLHTIAQGSTSHPGLMATVCCSSFHTSSGKSPTTRLLLQSLAGMALILRNLFWSLDCSTPLQVVKQQLPFNECPCWQFQLMDTTESPHPCACSLGRSRRKRGADLLDLAFSATAYFFPPLHHFLQILTMPSCTSVFPASREESPRAHMCSWWCTVVASYQEEHVELWAQTEDRTRVGSSQMEVACGFSESGEFCPLETN